jgi:Cu-Zn family superoxide dismutase
MPLKNEAIAVFQGTVKGSVHFIEENGVVKIELNLTGLKKNGYHGFHVHEYGDLSDGCNSACAHFNPYKKTHGCPGMSQRHVGDLGNIVTDQNGDAKYTFYDNMIKLRGTKSNIIGRMVIIHADPDDCGQGVGPLRAESLKTGNAGKRIACAVIGHCKKL